MSSVAPALAAGTGQVTRTTATESGWRHQLATALLAGDLVAAATATLVASRLGLEHGTAELVAGRMAVPHGLVALVIVATWPLVLAVHEAYVIRAVAWPLAACRSVLDAGLSALVALAVTHLLLGTSIGPRYVILLVGSAVGLSLAVRVAGGWLVDWQRRQGRWMHRAVLHGPPGATAELARRLRDRRTDGMAVAAVVTHRSDERQLLDTLDHVGADVLAVAGEIDPSRLRALAQCADCCGVELLALRPAGVAPPPAPSGPSSSVGRREPAARLRLVHVGPGRATGVAPVAKAVTERVIAAVLLLALSPLLLVTVALVRSTSPGPALFRQPRVGRYGRPFTILKFRTMEQGADARLATLLAQNETDGLLFKIPNDPRITPIGRLLRRASIDELPQLWNVVRGDMSLVGPRPLPVRADGFTALERRRHAVRPGLTGLSQISGRSDLSWRDTIGLDLDYVDNWSLALDLSIVLRTPAAVVRAHGAY